MDWYFGEILIIVTLFLDSKRGLLELLLGLGIETHAENILEN
jgi:hypothetical protein